MRLIDADSAKTVLKDHWQWLSDGEYADGLYDAIKLLEKVPTIDPTYEVKHYLEAEIQITVERQADNLNPFYNGVCVGEVESVMLRNRHIRFCQHLLYLIEKGERAWHRK